MGHHQGCGFVEKNYFPVMRTRVIHFRKEVFHRILTEKRVIIVHLTNFFPAMLVILFFNSTLLHFNVIKLWISWNTFGKTGDRTGKNTRELCIKKAIVEYCV